MDVLTRSFSFGDIFSNILDSFSSTISLNLLIPADIVYRTELMCMYIEEEVGCSFDINTFLYILYIDFTEKAVRRYNPKKVLDMATRHNTKPETITIVIDGAESIYNKNTTTYNEVLIHLDKRESKKGQLVLNELHEVFGTKISFETLISNLWINFINTYKDGSNKKAYSNLVKMLKSIL